MTIPDRRIEHVLNKSTGHINVIIKIGHNILLPLRTYIAHLYRATTLSFDAASLLHNHTLQILNLTYNKLEHDGVTALVAALQRNKSLQQLRLASTNISVDSIKTIIAALQHNTLLQQLCIAKA